MSEHVEKSKLLDVIARYLKLRIQGCYEDDPAWLLVDKDAIEVLEEGVKVEFVDTDEAMTVFKRLMKIHKETLRKLADD